MSRPAREAGLGIVPGPLSAAVIVTIVVQLSAVIWFLARLEGRVEVNEQFRLASAPLQAQMTRLDERFDAVFRDLDRIERRLMRLEEHFAGPGAGDRSR
jgi:hypothetical protein